MRSDGENFANRNSEAPSPAQVLRNKSAIERREVGPVGEEEGENAHIEAALVDEIQIANCSRTNSHGRACANTIKDPRHQ